MSELSERTRASAPLTAAVSLAVAVAAAAISGTVGVFAARERLAADWRAEQAAELRRYPTREELLIELDRRFDRLETRLLERLRERE